MEFGVCMMSVRLIQMSLIETYSKVRIGKDLLDKFPIQNCLKQGDALSPLFFNCVLGYVIRRVQGKLTGLEWDSSAMVYCDDIKNTIKKIAEALIDASEEFGLEVNTEKT
jgi:hypothetical protein